MAPVGSVSQTQPRSTSSQDSQRPQGVAPPAQLARVPDRMRRAPTMRAAASKRSALAPPPVTTSLLETYVQPSGCAKQAPPSGAGCQR